MTMLPNSYTNSLLALIILGGGIVFLQCRTGKLSRLFFSSLVFLNAFFVIIHKGADYFTGNGIDHATIILLRFGFDGLELSNYFKQIFLYSGLLIMLLVSLVLFIFRASKARSDSLGKKISAYILIFAAFIINPATIDLYNLPKGTFIPSRASSDIANVEFYKYYKRPTLKTRDLKPKNLVFIYAESLERAFFNEDVFPGLVPGLKKLEKSGIVFTNMHMTHGTGGTIWAISASQCGLPLFLPNKAILTHNRGRFLPSAVCLGDVLENEGYHLVFYGGAQLSFTGKGYFFKSHGFEEVFGRDELRSQLDDPNYLNHWGLYDDSLLDISYERFINLSESGEKFGLFLLTVDAHSPGYSSKNCEDILYQDGENTHLNAIACTDYQLAEFVKKISESPYADQTSIIIASDHVNWDNTPSNDLLKQAREGKKNTFMIIEPGIKHGKTVDTRGTAFDIGATILPFIGYDGEVGLGRDLLDVSEQDVDDIKYIQTRLFNWKTEILKFWGQLKIKKNLSIDMSNNRINIDGLQYDIPVILELDKDFSATLLFNLRTFHLAKYMKELKSDQKLLMIHPCKDIEVSGNLISNDGKPISQQGWCFMASTGKQVHFLDKIDGPMSYDASSLKRLFEIPDASF